MTLSFGKLGQKGRLGNQLFQIVSTMGLAEKHNTQAVFPAWVYEKYFEPIPHGAIQNSTLKEEYYRHYEWKISGDCDIQGYLQSEKYFGSFRLIPKAEEVEKVKARLTSAFEKQTICIHVRRGDYIGNPNYYQLSVMYYIDALLTHFPDWRNCNIVFISDDIEYCRTHFECMSNAYFPAGFTDIEHMLLASACDHFIIPNSTYGWWCAYLGEKPGTQVVCPGRLFAGNLLEQNDSQDFYPQRWISHQKEDCHIPLKDVTFTIPVSFDHDDRIQNLNLSLCLLQKSFDSNYIICEQGGEHFSYTEQYAVYSKMNLSDFHRTRMLNWMAEISETRYVVNWDADVIIPPMQLYLAVEKLRAGADMVFPYDGRFARMPREPWFKDIEKSLDIGIVGKKVFENRVEGHMSVGGAVMFNRDSFLDGGLENENMIAYGPEDYERDYRFRILGYDIQRVGGSLFHIQHFIGPNSSKGRNPHYARNWAEWEKIRKMSRVEMQSYIATWSWRDQYTSRYYQSIQEGAVRSAKIVMEALNFKPQTVIDVGCGLGEWHNGNQDYFGVDYGVKQKDMLMPADHYIDHDLTKGRLRLGRKFDLCLCLEVAEHLPENCAEDLVELLCELSDKILFSAAIPNQGGTGHVNEQFQTYWARLFEKFGFGASLLQPAISQCEEVELWYRQNTILYEHGGTGKVVDFVLPEYYVQIILNLHNRLQALGR